ncbi:Long-chain-fatty-acid--CoA ligase FadD13 [Brevundimonas sp. NIBR10]|uniref:AMP-binding protein n=1 Tax=Brevundimonas sp. NIBR10 TaxID=3015997 RepID=UPI0022F1D70F|nr:AMP-binding protein [Brevundimonas sp. NIBR10]WGM48129.1 Long-chain-fatty-acid--CoA ligase FadD13 [Brevundimonas sp. NIBR10]
MGPIDDTAFQARRQPDALAAVDLASGRRWTYAELDRAVGRCADLLRHRHGCSLGDRVASLAKNRVELIILHLACARAGLTYVPLNWRLSGPEIAVLVADAEPRLIVGDGALGDLAPIDVTLDDLAQQIDGHGTMLAETADPERVSLILFTSGTSGTPKGVMLSERAQRQTAINFSLLGQVDARSRILIGTPMFHIIGLITSVRPIVMQGGVMLVSDGFEPGRTLARLSDPNLAVTHYFCVPQMADRIRAQPEFDGSRLGHMTALFTGGAPHPAASIMAWLDAGVPVVDGFGMSEAGTVLGMALDPTIIAAKAGAAGIPAPGTELRLVDASENDVRPGEPGELLLSGPNLFSGYWRRPDEMARAFTADGWFRTGDIAVCDADGYLTIVDRRKDMYISGGENVYPAEIEAALADFPGLIEVAIVGVPDARWGEVGVCAMSHVDADETLAERVRTHLASRLAGYKLPRHVLVVEALPRTGSGKVRKGDLRTLCLARLEASDDAASPVG